MPPGDHQVKTMVESHVTPHYLHFLEHRDLRQFIRTIMGWDEEILLQRTLLRHNVPGGLCTGIHYNKLFLRDGDSYFLTAWVPLGDTSINGGGLIYLSNSASLGKFIEDDFTKRAASLPETERINAFNVNMTKTGMLSYDVNQFREHEAGGKGRSLVSDYEAGDVIFHNPYTNHGSVKNEDGNGRIRLSTDLRFYKAGSDLDTRWTKYWTPDDGL